MESIAAAPVGKTVADHGEGVPHDFVPHLFERFTRATTGSAVTQKGTGLGLYIVWQLAHVNRARVTYQDNRPSGARFVLHLAAAPADEQPPGAARRQPRPAAGDDPQQGLRHPLWRSPCLPAYRWVTRSTTGAGAGW